MKHASLKHPGRWIWLLVLIPAAIGFARLHFSVEIFDLLPQNLSVVQGLKIYQEHFSNARELIITLQSSDPLQTEQAARGIAERLRQHTNLVSSVTGESPWLEHPGQGGEFGLKRIFKKLCLQAGTSPVQG